MTSQKSSLARLQPPSYNTTPFLPTTSPYEKELHNTNNGVPKNLDDYFNSFPPGYFFRPTHEELITFYLSKKIKNEPIPPNRMAEVDIYLYNPETLCKQYRSVGEDEWYFFSPRERRYPNGDRPKRSTEGGYWKVLGIEKLIYSEGILVGRWNTLVFYEGKAPKGTKTKWIMREYRLADHSHQRTSADDMTLDDYVLCKLYKKPGNPNTSDRTNGERKKMEMGGSETNDTAIDRSNEYNLSLPEIPPSNECITQSWSEVPTEQTQCNPNYLAWDDHMALTKNEGIPPDLRTSSFETDQSLLEVTPPSYEHNQTGSEIPPSYEYVTQSCSEIPQDQPQCNPSNMACYDHVASNMREGISPGSRTFSEFESSGTFPETKSSGLVLAEEPFNYCVPSMEDTQCCSEKVDATLGSKSTQMEPITLNPPSPGLAIPTQYYNQEDLGWDSVKSLQNFGSLPLFDPDYHIVEHVKLWDNIQPNNSLLYSPIVPSNNF